MPAYLIDSQPITLILYVQGLGRLRYNIGGGLVATVVVVTDCPIAGIAPGLDYVMLDVALEMLATPPVSMRENAWHCGIDVCKLSPMREAAMQSAPSLWSVVASCYGSLSRARDDDIWMDGAAPHG